ncbi:hypothetical protein V1527DRAFT_454192 [Lipomyces starkeyi]
MLHKHLSAESDTSPPDAAIIDYVDSPENTTGGLTSTISKDAEGVEGTSYKLSLLVYDQSSSFACEAASSVKVVASLLREQDVL